LGHRQLRLALLVLCLLVPAVAFAAIPTISSFTPTSVVAGSTTVVTLTGTNLSPTTAMPGVKVGLTAATVVSSTTTQIQFRVPLAARTNTITVTTAGGTSAPSASTLVVVLRPDLRMDFVHAPAVMIAGIAGSIATSVTNVGTAAAGPFKVGIYLFGGETFDLAHAVLVAVRPVAGLAVGAASSATTSITFPDNIDGDGLRFAAIADFDNTLPEVVERTNNIAIAGNQTAIGPNLVGTFNAQGPLALSAGPPGGVFTCLNGGVSVAGSQTFTGHATVSSQTASSEGIGFTASFALAHNSTTVNMTTSNGLLHTNGTITGSAAVTIGGPFAATGSGTFGGNLDDGITLTLTGQTATGPRCLMGGTLTITPPPSFKFGYLVYSHAGSFANNTIRTPAVTFPKAVEQYAASFSVDFDTALPAASQVKFTGPAGSGMTTQTAANANNSQVDDHNAFYESPVQNIVNPPTGSWLVLYKSVNKPFSVTTAPAPRFIVPFPTITLNNDGSLASIDWVFRNATTGAIIPVPAYVRRQQLQIDGSNGRVYDSEHLIPAATSQAFSAGALPWACVSTLHMTFNDDATNHFVVSYTKTPTGTCPNLNGGGEPSLQLAFNFTQGTFSGTTVSLPPLPIASYYFANFNSGFDPNPPASVFFTGPTGSGLSNTESATRFVQSDGSGAGYNSPQRTQVPPGGTWTVNYEGQPLAFTLPNPDSTNRGILVVPTVTLSGGNVTEVQWQYKNSLGGLVSPPPAFMRHVELRIDGLVSGQVVRLYGQDDILPGTLFHVLTQPVSWSTVTQIQMVVHDDLGNSYTSYWSHALPPAPTITSINPTSAHVGNTITITGTNFGCDGCVGGVNAVRFTKTGGTGSTGVAALFTINSPTQITATVPTGAITGTVWIQALGATATSPTFTLLP
jgi:hypothetical protein